MSVFFNETCKVMQISRARTTPYRPSSNGMVERFHRSLNAGLTHYFNVANTNWDEILLFLLMSYRAMPNTARGYSPFFLLHGREMTLPSNKNLKAKLTKADPSLSEWMDKLKAGLKQVYKSASIASKASHQNKKHYDRRAKQRSFEVADFMYLYNRARKPRLSKNFHRVSTGPCQITAKISDLNYEIIGKNGKSTIAYWTL